MWDLSVKTNVILSKNCQNAGVFDLDGHDLDISGGCYPNCGQHYT